jgi:outer membrane lipoprotein-sorting protein
LAKRFKLILITEDAKYLRHTQERDMNNGFKQVIFSIGVLLAMQGNVAVAGNYTEQSIKSYMAPILELHKTAEEKKGLDIYEHQYLIDEGWGDIETEMRMVLIDPSGRESERKVIKRILEDGNQPDKTMGLFLEPADLRGTVMLTFEQSYDADEQWLYMPSLKRTKKINAENKSGSFLGTEFSWEDISTTELSKYHYKFLRDDGNAWVIERDPVYKFSGYSKETTWVNKDNYQTTKIEYYDQKNDLLKTLELTEWEQYKGRYWRSRHYEITNFQNHRKTILYMSPYKFGAGIDKATFSSLGLDRIKLTESK